MATRQGTKRVGRPSKGDRHAFMVRLPQEAADEVFRRAEVTGQYWTDLISELVVAGLEVTPAPKRSRQRKRPVQAAMDIGA